jgi:hypothetical protein
MIRVTGVVRKHKVSLPTDLDIPDGTAVTVVWEDPGAPRRKQKPYERRPLTKKQVLADLAWATGKRFEQ